MHRVRRRGERGASSIELVMYMPLLMVAIILTVQFVLVYLATQAASASAREAARVARVTADVGQGVQKGESYAANLGAGFLESVRVEVVQVGDDQVRATVRGRAPTILPFLDLQGVEETAQGPIEEFREDAP